MDCFYFIIAGVHRPQYHVPHTTLFIHHQHNGSGLLKLELDSPLDLNHHWFVLAVVVVVLGVVGNFVTCVVHVEMTTLPQINLSTKTITLCYKQDMPTRAVPRASF